FGIVSVAVAGSVTGAIAVAVAGAVAGAAVAIAVVAVAVAGAVAVAEAVTVSVAVSGAVTVSVTVSGAVAAAVAGAEAVATIAIAVAGARAAIAVARAGEPPGHPLPPPNARGLPRVSCGLATMRPGHGVGAGAQGDQQPKEIHGQGSFSHCSAAAGDASMMAVTFRNVIDFTAGLTREPCSGPCVARPSTPCTSVGQ